MLRLTFKKSINFSVRNFSSFGRHLNNKLALQFSSVNLIKNWTTQFSNFIFNQSPKLVSICLLMASLSETEKEFLSKADELYDENKLEDLIPLLKEKINEENVSNKHEFQWRYARCIYSQYKEKKRSSQELTEARDLVLQVLEKYPECGPAHKWAAILIDAVGSSIGTKERIKQLFNVRGHMEKAVQYNATDPTSYYLLGEFHYSCYNVSWAERQIAKVIFSSLPDADLEEALRLFKKAEELEPGFYSKNLVLLAKTLYALKKEPELAKECLNKVVNNYKDSKKWDDIEAVKEANDLLKKYKK